MESYAQVLNYAIPFFIILIGIEWLVGLKKGVITNRSMDTVSSLSSGLTNSIKDVLGLSIAIVSYEYMVERMALYSIESEIWMYVVAFVGLDFAGYWSHRISHEVNLFWNRHIIHHSSEEFNLACALRQSISNVFAIFFFLLIPLAIVGVPTKVIAIVAPLHLFAQFWYHTRLIDKMGILEKLIVTPSHHRVHHAINPEYLDKNYSQIFIFWDKLFGTFQEELEDVPAVYGVKRAVKTWNPILINYQHLMLLLSDSLRTKKWWDKLRLWMMPTGWRPDDVIEKYPVSFIENPNDQVKYDVEATTSLKTWSWIQFIVTVLLMLYLFNNISELTLTQMLLYGLFLFSSIFAYTSLMDRSRWTLIAEALKFTLGFSLIYWLGNWYGIGKLGTGIVVAYMFLSLILTVYFMKTEKIKETNAIVSV